MGAEHLAAHSAKTNSRLYLHVTKTKTPKPVTADAPPEPTTLDGLLQASKEENLFDVHEVLAVVAVDGETGTVAASTPFPHPEMPMVVADAAAAVHGHASAGTLEEVKSLHEASSTFFDSSHEISLFWWNCFEVHVRRLKPYLHCTKGSYVYPFKFSDP